jgi:hypothetical protein
MCCIARWEWYSLSFFPTTSFEGGVWLVKAMGGPTAPKTPSSSFGKGGIYAIICRRRFVKFDKATDTVGDI